VIVSEPTMGNALRSRRSLAVVFVELSLHKPYFNKTKLIRSHINVILLVGMAHNLCMHNRLRICLDTLAYL